VQAVDFVAGVRLLQRGADGRSGSRATLCRSQRRVKERRWLFTLRRAFEQLVTPNLLPEYSFESPGSQSAATTDRPAVHAPLRRQVPATGPSTSNGEARFENLPLRSSNETAMIMQKEE